MNRAEERERRIEELEERLSRLSEASLRITESLDFDTVLQDVVDSARSLTASRYGAINTVDEAGQLSAFTVSGVSMEEYQGLWDMPEGHLLSDYLGSFEEPLRIPDLGSHLSALNMPALLPEIAAISLLVVPIRLQGVRIGTIFLAHDEDGREFTQEDEETLALLASHAAMAIVNARRHRDERRARADLETLVETSPVGVVVLDGATGAPKSFNREAGRIVDSLLNPGQALEDLINAVTVRRADGREVSLREFPLAQVLGSGETVRGEEIVLCVPDGRSVTVLMNATPILSDGGVVESMVVTFQDMAAVEELERMRAEFLAMVSHELRAPLTSIKGSAATALGARPDLDPAVVRQFFHIIEDQADHMHDLVADLLDVARIETGSLAVGPEPAEVAVLIDRARSAFSSAGSSNRLAIDIGPDLPLVLADRQRITQVIGNLISNAARNSPESSVIRVTAAREDVHVAISVIDEGRGIPADSLPLLFRKFSRAQPEEQGGDTGLGLAICKGIVEAHGGRIWAESDGPGLGARFTFTLPVVEGTERGTTGIRTTFPAPSARSAQGEETRTRVLAVDDDPQDLRYIQDTLAKAGYEPLVAGDTEDALRLMETEKPQVVLLDFMLRGTDGIELMKQILEVDDVPVIFLSAYGRDELITAALDTGAVDYVVKPFSPSELSARIRAALRLRAVSEPSEPYVVGDLIIDYAARRVTLAGQPLHLTPTEYRMLAVLSANAGRALTHRQLLEEVWRGRSDTDVRAMRTMVGKLRRKLGEDATSPSFILTEPRIGYSMPNSEAQA